MRSFWAIFDYFPAFCSYIFAEFLEISTKLLLFLWRCVIILSRFDLFANVLTLRKIFLFSSKKYVEFDGFISCIKLLFG